jgi:probable FeS assembly SUF system protein SufT
MGEPAAGGEETRPLGRDVDAIEIPAGFWVTLAAGTPVRVMQALGDTYTVMVDGGFLVRVMAEDADALGREPPARTSLPADAPLEDQVWAQLRTCYDPEIPVDIVELGLVYGCTLTPQEDGRSRVKVDLTLTAPGCGMGDVLCDDVRRTLRGLPGVADVEVEVVLDPPWDPSRMSEAARLQLGML